MADPGDDRVLCLCRRAAVHRAKSTADAMAALADYREIHDASRRRSTQSRLPDAERDALGEAIGDADHEYAARRLLAGHGIGAVRRHGGDSVTRLAAGSIGGPAVMKIQSPDILHKTEAGGVRLAIETPEAAAAAYEELVASAKAYNSAARIAGVLVEPMAPSGVELILGVQNDSSFGPTIMVGLGGIFTEIFEDTVLSLPVARPRSGDRAAETPERCAPAVRSARPAARRCRRRRRPHRRALPLCRPRRRQNQSIDLNPVIVHSEGHGLSVVDALIVPAGD